MLYLLLEDQKNRKKELSDTTEALEKDLADTTKALKKDSKEVLKKAEAAQEDSKQDLRRESSDLRSRQLKAESESRKEKTILARDAQKKEREDSRKQAEDERKDKQAIKDLQCDFDSKLDLVEKRRAEAEKEIKKEQVQLSGFGTDITDLSRRLMDSERTLAAAMSGDLAMTLKPATDLLVKAADLNAAAALALTGKFDVCLGRGGEASKSINFTPVLTPAEAVADVDVSAPTASGSFSSGRMRCTVVYDTDAGATKTYVAYERSTGQIVFPAASAFIDGETFTLIDGNSDSQIFEFCEILSVAAGNIAVHFNAGDTAAQIAKRACDAINRTNSIKIKATVSGATLSLEQKVYGTGGDQTISDTVADAGLVPTSFTGGVDGDSMSVAVKVAADDEMLGWSVASVTKTIKCV